MMAVITAYIHADRDGIPANRNCYAAWEGFAERGAAAKLFVPADHCTADRQKLTLDLNSDTVVHGTIPVVHAALRTLGIDPPAPLDYPDSLQRFLGRKVWETDLGRARDSASWPLFIKPRYHGKAFAGLVVRAFRNLLSTGDLPDEYPVWASEILEFESEWRIFVLNGEVLDARPYGHEAFRAVPGKDRVCEMISAFENRPIAFALDVGVSNGETFLVEANDAYSLGTYGLDPMLYAKLIHARWSELTEGR